MSNINHKSFFYPPGGILIWIVIYLELLTYGMAIAALVYYGAEQREAFHQDSLLLNRPIATINTLLLLTGGWLVAKGIQFFKADHIQKALNYFSGAILTGVGFLILKLVEYYLKIDAGLDMNYSLFYMFYWLLTGFHWIHVLVGVVILFFIRRSISKKKNNAVLEDIEAGAAFWHLCDLIWLFLFPLLYLIF